MLKPSESIFRLTRALILLTTLYVLHGVNGRSTSTDKGWLRVCNNFDGELNSKHYEVEAEKCPHGAWLSESLHGGCICLNGLWAISQSWCDEDYFVAYGKGHSFSLDFPIQKLAFLGNPDDAFQTTNFVTKENGHVFRTFSNEFIMPYEFSRETNRTIMRLKPNKGTGVIFEVRPDTIWQEEYIKIKMGEMGMFFQEEAPICVDTDFKNDWKEDEALMIYKVRTGIKYIKVTKNCPKPIYSEQALDHEDEEVSVHKVLPGQAIHVKSGTVINSSNLCSSTCSTNRESHNEASTLIRHKRQALEILELDRDLTNDDRDEIVRTANLRVAKQELNWLLDNIRPPTLKTPNWMLMQKLKEIFAKACPEKETPKFLINAMMRLFRLFYLNSRDFFPNGHMMEESAQNDRLSNTLDLCLNDATEFKFNYDTFRNQTDEPCRQSLYGTTNHTILYCPCQKELSYVNVSYALNQTGPASEHLVYGKYLQVREDLIFIIPEDDKFDADILDFPTETLWKVVMFTHFYCAKYFRHNPGDFSSLFNKMEDYFNEDIIYRWTKPGGSSFRIWQYLYGSFDLKKFAKSVDSCVAGAKFISAYPEWLNRPTLDIRRRRKRSLDSAKLWKGHAYCLNDPWDPVYKLRVDVHEKCADLNSY